MIYSADLTQCTGSRRDRLTDCRSASCACFYATRCMDRSQAVIYTDGVV